MHTVSQACKRQYLRSSPRRVSKTHAHLVCRSVGPHQHPDVPRSRIKSCDLTRRCWTGMHLMNDHCGPWGRCLTPPKKKKNRPPL